MNRIGRTRAGVFIVLGAVAMLAGSIRIAQAFPYSAPMEDVRLKP